MEGTKDEKYSRLGVRDKRSETLKVSGRAERLKYSRLGGMDERLKIHKVRWKGWKIRNTLG